MSSNTGKTMILITDMTLTALFDALVTLDEQGYRGDSKVTLDEIRNRPGLTAMTVIPAAAHKGVKQRCAMHDADGRRCIRGPRHRENHRYEEVEG